jgi:hypothetical protein
MWSSSLSFVQLLAAFLWLECVTSLMEGAFDPRPVRHRP